MSFFASPARRLATLIGLVAAGLVLFTPGALGFNPNTEVTVGSNDAIF